MINKKNTKKYGMTLVEIIVSTGIMLLIGVGIATFQRDIFFLNSATQNSLSVQMDGRRILRTLIAELRSANRSSLGSYPIASAGTSTLIFYSNIDSDIYFERVRYFLQGKDLKRGVIKPAGNPLAYNTSAESVETIIRNVSNESTTPIFEYFSSTYAGTSTALTYPIDNLSVRLVRVTVHIDSDPNREPQALIMRSQAMLRNLKDNQ